MQIRAAIEILEDHHSDGGGPCFCTDCEAAGTALREALPADIKEADRSIKNDSIDKAKAEYDKVMNGVY